MGFGAGLEGRGGQFLQQLQEPQREYKRQLERYNQEGTDLGVRALERAQREQEQKTRRAQEVSDQQLQAEFQRETRRLRLTDDREKALLEDMLVSRRQREHDERAAEEARRKEKADKEEQRNKIYADLVKAPNYTPTKIANEIADNIISGKPMSASAEKWRSLQVRKLEKQLAGLKGGGGTGGGKTMAVLEGGQTIPVSLVDQKTGRVIIDGKPVKVVGYVGGGATGAPAQAKQAGPVMAQPPAQTVRDYAKRFGISEDQARRELSGQH
jgi:hypothetical protein